jgi:hypothetical protein
MMNTTKEVKEFYEVLVAERLEKVMAEIQADGFTDDAKTSLRLFKDDLERYLALETAFQAHHEEGGQSQVRKGA